MLNGYIYLIAHYLSLKSFNMDSLNTKGCADKISNLRDILASPPKDWSSDRKREYFIWAEKVVEALHGSNAPMEKIFEGLLGEGKRLG